MNSLTWSFIEINVLIVLLFVAYMMVRHQVTLRTRRVFLNSIPLFAVLLVGMKSFFDFTEFSYSLQMIELDPVIIDAVGTESVNHSMSFGLVTIYQLGLLLVAPVFLYRLIRVIAFFIKNQSTKEGHYRIYKVAGKDSFSFFNQIQISPELSVEDQEIVIEHEKLHVNKWHSLDVLIAELMHVLLWVNPVFFWMKRELINLHEFQVDELMYRKHKVNYLKFLVNYALGFNGPHYLLTSRFYNQLSLKKRIQNMKTRTKTRMWMMVIIPILGIATLLVQCTKNQEPKEEVAVEKTDEPERVEPVYDAVEVEPRFKGEEGALSKYLVSEITYPEAAKIAGIEGTVYVKFVVKSDGSIQNVKVMKGADELLNTEALRVISGMPDWIPGMQDGENVSVAYTIPIRFALPPIE